MIQLFPFMCAEALELPFEYRWNGQVQEKKIRVKRTELQKDLSKGGMPGIFAARNSSETLSYWKALIDSYVYRDLLFAVPKNPKPALALKILKAVAEILALGETPTFSRILKKTGGARAQVERHVQGLEDLMILQRVPHLDASSTKDMFLFFDTALFLTLLDLDNAQHDVAVHLSCLQIRMSQEILAAQQITDFQQPVYYAESPQGQKVHLITKDKQGNFFFFQIYEEPVPHDYDLRFLKAQAKKWKGTATALTSLEKAQVLPDVVLLPWEQVL
jgi:predicted AAA+ superfamily ATPase